MKSKFENMIGKEVDWETFRAYEEMYLVLPEGITKQQFVEMLNINAIPESPEAIERRKLNEEYKAGILSEINRLKDELKQSKERIEDIKIWINMGDEDGFWKSQLKHEKSSLERIKTEIRVQKMLLI